MVTYKDDRKLESFGLNLDWFILMMIVYGWKEKEMVGCLEIDG